MVGYGRVFYSDYGDKYQSNHVSTNFGFFYEKKILLGLYIGGRHFLNKSIANFQPLILPAFGFRLGYCF